MRNFWNHWRDCKAGVAAVEFAFVAPILLTLLLGGYELGQYFLVHQKVEKVAYTVADVTSQQTSVTGAQLNQILESAAQIMDPYEFGSDGVVIITSVYKADATSQPVVRWQYSGGGTLARSSKIGTKNQVAALPDGLTLNAADNIILAETYYEFAPQLTEAVIGEEELYKVAIYKPRLGALITDPN